MSVNLMLFLNDMLTKSPTGHVRSHTNVSWIKRRMMGLARQIWNYEKGPVSAAVGGRWSSRMLVTSLCGWAPGCTPEPLPPNQWWHLFPVLGIGVAPWLATTSRMHKRCLTTSRSRLRRAASVSFCPLQATTRVEKCESNKSLHGLSHSAWLLAALEVT